MNTASPIHPADLQWGGTLVKVTVTMDMLVTREDPVKGGVKKGLVLIDLHVLRYEEDERASSEHPDAEEDYEHEVSVDPTSVDPASTVAAEGVGFLDSMPQGPPVAQLPTAASATATTTTTFSSTAEGLPDVLRAVHYRHIRSVLVKRRGLLTGEWWVHTPSTHDTPQM
jgi:hypothetical protein